MAEQKTNVMRLLEQRRIPYIAHAYPHDGEAVDGLTVAAMVGLAPRSVFKTLVARGASKGVYVFVLPVDRELELKKAAKAVGEKSVDLVPVSEITALTGYVRGSCSPIGMKKAYPTVFHRSVETLARVAVSAGRIGLQVELEPMALMALCRGKTADIATEE